MHLSLPFGFQPGTKAFQVNRALGAHALAGWNQRIGLVIFAIGIVFPVFRLCAPAYFTNGFFRLFWYVCWTDASYLLPFLSNQNLVPVAIYCYRMFLLARRPIFLLVKSILVQSASLDHCSRHILSLFDQFYLIQIDWTTRTANIIEIILLVNCRRVRCSTWSLQLCRRIELLLLWRSISICRSILLRRRQDRFNGLHIICIVNVAHSQSDPTHLYDTVLFKFDTLFAFEVASGRLLDCAIIVLDNQPKFLLGLAEHLGNFNLIAVIEPKAFLLAHYLGKWCLVALDAQGWFDL